MSNKLITLTLLSGTVLASAVANAATTNPAYPANPEHSFTAYDTPAMTSRAAVLKELADFRKNPVTADGWQYVGGEREWAEVPHMFVLRGGKLEHVDAAAHGPMTTDAAMRPVMAQDPSLYKNAV